MVLREALGIGGPMPKDAFKAVNGVSLEIHEGERVGLIGANGAGKSTLLHMIANLSAPTVGIIEVQGRVTCIMHLGVGIRDDLSGRENIFVEMEALGMSRAEAETHVREIVEFAELGGFIDHPVRTYSSGMKARLAFSMLSSADPEILIVDEALSTGDAAFAVKSTRRMKEIARKGGISIIVSHSMATIREMCNRCIWMRDGQVEQDGDPSVVTDAYLQWVRKRDNEHMLRVFGKRQYSQPLSRGSDIAIVFRDIRGRSGAVMEAGAPIEMIVKIKSDVPVEVPDMRLTVEKSDGLVMFDRLASTDGDVPAPLAGEAMFTVPLGNLCLGGGIYDVGVALIDRTLGAEGNVIAVRHVVLKIENPYIDYGNPLLLPDAMWSYEDAIRP